MSSSLERRMRRSGSVQQTTLDELLFGSAEAPTDEHREMRRTLIGQFRAVMAEFDERDPVKLIEWLRRERETFADEDQKSKAVMAMLDDIDALMGEEAEEGRKRRERVVQ